jgi:Peptidase S24-like
VTGHSRLMHVDHARLEPVHAVKCELAAKVLRLLGSLRLQVTGFSMVPSVWPGEVLLVRRQQIREIFPGDIVLFLRNGTFSAHRVVCRTDDQEITRLITRGDALRAQDSAITPAELLGKVCFIYRAGQWIAPPTRLSFSVRLMAGLVAHSGRAGTVLVRLHATWRRLRRKQEVLWKS